MSLHGNSPRAAEASSARAESDRICGARTCAAVAPALARLRGWTQKNGKWLCPRHRGYTTEQMIADMTAMMREVAPTAGWKDELQQHRAKMAAERSAFLAREEKELDALGRLNNLSQHDAAVDWARAIGRKSVSRLCTFVLATGDRKMAAAHAVEALAEIDDVQARDAIVRACAHEDRLVRATGADALRHVPDDRRLGILLVLLEDEWAPARTRAAESLGFTGDARAADPLAALLRDSNVSVRGGAAEGLARLGDPRGLSYFAEAMQSDDDITQSDSKFRLDQLGLGGAIRLLTTPAPED